MSVWRAQNMFLYTFLRVHGKRVSVKVSLLASRPFIVMPTAKAIAVEDDEEAQLKELQAALAM